ncbi:hypothetical protein F6R97_04370 [Pseudomonas sp. JV414]|uniref:hypothetical protein n=1 Tax=Pseudomonas sp. JV414 TaxID=1733110 RepID=UPI0028E0C59E|nr:hypothetical protein [Pseudomonas sp. JV414]MDT9673888.1 hypothetical protein [Pseudomonas sp. JV414]
MKRDWVVWLGCVSLFGAGVVWGAIPKGTEFFDVKNVHDLAEIIGSLATAAALIFAVAGYSAWKKQVVETSDHELAKRASLSFRKYRTVLPDAFRITSGLMERINFQVSYRETPHELLEVVNEELSNLKNISTEVHSLALECRSSWGESVWPAFQDAFFLGDHCLVCIGAFVSWSKIDMPDKLREKYAVSAINSFEAVKILAGENVLEIENYFEEKFGPLHQMLNEKKLK